VAEAFAAEVRHYRPRADRGRDAESLAALRHECVGVFLDQLGISAEPGAFVEQFMGALAFRPVDGAVDVLESLRRRGIVLAVAANWDCSLGEQLEQLGIGHLFSAVVTSAEAGRPKPEPAVLQLALARVGVEPNRALHVGDESADEQAALATGMSFRYAPLAAAFEGWE
jgi:HAD superfamily hydrolase (TIGR01509 family)